MEFPTQPQFKINPSLKPKEFVFYVGDDAVEPAYFKDLYREVNLMLTLGIDCTCIVSSEFVVIEIEPKYAKSFYFIYSKYFNFFNDY